MPYSKDPDSFPPEYLEIYRRGYEAPVRIQLSSPGDATALRHRLHAYRRALVAATSPFATLANSCRVKLDGAFLIVEPSTLELRDALASAGFAYDPKEASKDHTQDEIEAGDALTAMLKKQGF